MTLTIQQQRERAINALSLKTAQLAIDTYTEFDTLLDNLVREAYQMQSRPNDSDPYIGWQTNNQKGTKGFNSQDFADLCRNEARKNLVWMPNGEAIKYTEPFAEIGFRGRFAWCAAFVRWCLINYGVEVPLLCKEYPGYAYALVESWQKMAQARQWYIDNDGRVLPRAGDIVLFDWNQRSIHEPDNDWEDHIGVFLERQGSNRFLCAEGNSQNRSGIFSRSYRSVQGYVRIPEGTKAI